MLKSTNLRLNKNNESEQIFCTQQWPRSLCTRDAINRFNSDYNHIDHYVTCLNPAEVWCDHPLCKEARCGKQGCLRCYRFLPRDYTLSANVSIVSRHSERSYDIVSFVKCCLCCGASQDDARAQMPAYAEQDFSSGFPSEDAQRVMAAEYLSARHGGRAVSVTSPEVATFVERCQPWVR